MISDLRFALRQLRKSPVFTFAAVLTLGLAIGVNSAMFAIVHRVLLRPTVERDAASLVNVFSSRKGEKAGYRQFSHTEYATLKENKEVFAEVAALNFSLAGVGREIDSQRRSFVTVVTENYFSIFGADFAQGRAFSAAECQPNANVPVAVLSDGYAKRLGGAAGLLGTNIRINGEAYTVVGIAPPSFTGGHALLTPDVWLPLGVASRLAGFLADSTARDLANPRNFALNVVGRLSSGLTVASAASRLPALDQRLATVNPAENGGPRSLEIQAPSRFNISTTPNDGEPTALLGTAFLGLSGVVLIIAGLNLANMLLARGAARRREIALRMAVGAQRGRIVRQLVTEGFVLALLGGAVGVVLAYWANSVLLASLSRGFQSMSFSLSLDFKPDLPLLAVTFGFCLLATLIFSVGPALRLSKPDLVNDLKQQAGDGQTGGSGWGKLFTLRNSLVMAQIALSLALVFCAALFVRGGGAAAAVDPGFKPAGVAIAEVDFSMSRLSNEEALPRLLQLRDRAAALPGVESVVLDTGVPYNNNINTRSVAPASEPLELNDPKQKPRIAGGIDHRITSGYFRTMGIPLVAGRDFTAAETERPARPSLAIVDEELAKRLFPKGDALGQRVRPVDALPDGTRPEMEIIGIVRTTRYETLESTARPHLYVPFAQSPDTTAFLHVKLANASPEITAAFLATLRKQLFTVDPNLPLPGLATLTDIMDRNIGLWIVRVGAALFAAFGAVALLIAAIGVYGVHSYAVARRTREIGIRMSLGARPNDVLKLILGHGARQTAVAMGFGLLLALGLGQVLSSMLYQVSPRDPIALASAVAALGGSALLACFIPAKRATRVDPSVALRNE